MILEDFIINEKYSSYGALEKIKRMGMKINFCLKTLYNYIHKKIFIKLPSKDLPYKKKYKNSFNKRFKTITVDNDSEFMNTKAMEK